MLACACVRAWQRRFAVAVSSALVLIKLANSRSERVGGARQTVRNMLSIGPATSIRCKQPAAGSSQQHSDSISASRQRPAPESLQLNSRKEINIKAKQQQQQTHKSRQLVFFSIFLLLLKSLRSQWAVMCACVFVPVGRHLCVCVELTAPALNVK